MSVDTKSNSPDGDTRPPRSKPGEKTICYYLGLNDDPATWLAFSSPGNFCHYVEKPAPVDFEHQQTYCLSANYLDCPVYKLRSKDGLPANVALNGNQNSNGLPNRWVVVAALTVIIILSVVALLLITRPAFVAEIIPPVNNAAGGGEETSTPAASTATATRTADVAVIEDPRPTATATASPAPTASPSPSATPLPPTPTATPRASTTPTASTTPSPSATLIPASPTPSPTPDLPQIVVNVNNLNVRSGPRVEYPVISIITRGTRLNITGRTNDLIWLRVCCLDETGSSGWVFTESVNVDGDLDSVPVVSDLPPLPDSP